MQSSNSTDDNCCPLTQAMWTTLCECSIGFNSLYCATLNECCPCLCVSCFFSGGSISLGLGLIWMTGTCTPLATATLFTPLTSCLDLSIFVAKKSYGAIKQCCESNNEPTAPSYQQMK